VIYASIFRRIRGFQEKTHDNETSFIKNLTFENRKI